MDWWNRACELLDESWIFIDMPHTLLQLGIDLFALVTIARHQSDAAAARLARSRRSDAW